MSSVVLFSSANKQGNTAQVVQALAQQVSLKVINLDELSITPYNYANQYPQDDFYPPRGNTTKRRQYHFCLTNLLALPNRANKSFHGSYD